MKYSQKDYGDERGRLFGWITERRNNNIKYIIIMFNEQHAFLFEIVPLIWREIQTPSETSILYLVLAQINV